MLNKIKVIPFMIIFLVSINLVSCSNTIEEKKRKKEIETLVSNTAKYGNDEIEAEVNEYLTENNISYSHVYVDDYNENKFIKCIDIKDTVFESNQYVKLNTIDDIRKAIIDELIISYTGDDEIDSKHMELFVDNLIKSKNMIEELKSVKVNYELNTLLIVTDSDSYKYRIKENYNGK